MNIFKLITRLKLVRTTNYLSSVDQALYYELVSVCNELKWKEVFTIRSAVLCDRLNISDKTLFKSRKALADVELVYFETSRDKRIGCYYSFVPELIDASGSYGLSSEKKREDIEGEKPHTPETSCVTASDDKRFSPIIYNKTITKEREELPCGNYPSPKKREVLRNKKQGESLVFPFHSESFMQAWKLLAATPKWKKKGKEALQISLNKLGKFEEAFAIEQIERAIEGNWTGVVFTETEEKYYKWLKQKNETFITSTTSFTDSFTDRKESVRNLADLAGSVLRGIATEKFT